LKKRSTSQALTAYQSYPRTQTHDVLPPPDYTHSRKHQPQAKPLWKRLLRTTAKLLCITLIVVLGFVGWKFYDNVAKLTGSRNPLAMLQAFFPAELKTTDGRTNILLAGYSVDDAGHGGAQLTDSIMVLSIDNKHKSAIIVSVPRDLWVDVPGLGYSKINAAYQYGESHHFSQPGYAPGGMGLLAQIIERDLGISTNYYALLNYTAFKDAVNAVGGVTVNLTSNDNPYGLYDPYTNLKLPNSTVTLDGQTALNLARARGDGPGSYGFPHGDFDRTEHQRQLLIALKDKASSSSVIANPFRVGQLADAAGNNVKTDMEIDEVKSLALQARKIPASSIVSIGLSDVNGKNMLRGYRSPGGQSALIPAAGIRDFSDIQAGLDGLLVPVNTTE
jgi:LCP family protein required for cell wall assembly